MQKLQQARKNNSAKYAEVIRLLKEEKVVKKVLLVKRKKYSTRQACEIAHLNLNTFYALHKKKKGSTPTTESTPSTTPEGVPANKAYPAFQDQHKRKLGNGRKRNLY